MISTQIKNLKRWMMLLPAAFFVLFISGCEFDELTEEDVEEAIDTLQGNSDDSEDNEETESDTTDVIDEDAQARVIDSILLSLPDSPYDYVAYADEGLPQHFTQGNDSVDQEDNTPNNNPITNHGATLGRVLFYDVNLSANDTTSCSSCHEQATGFSDSAVRSVGFQGGLTPRHSMSLANNRFYERGRYFWDERAASLEEQVLMPIEDAIEMGMSLDDLVVKLNEIEYYEPLFENAFGDSVITSERIALALAQFTRSMVSYQSRFDQAQIEGDDILTANERAGETIFNGRGRCDNCHENVTQSTEEPHNIGLDANTPDIGAGNGEFKVPSLRNVAVSAPYMHDGRFSTLSEVIDHYNTGIQNHPNLDNQLREDNGQPRRLNLSAQERQQLEAFLNTLTDPVFLNADMFSDPFVNN